MGKDSSLARNDKGEIYHLEPIRQLRGNSVQIFSGSFQNRCRTGFPGL